METEYIEVISNRVRVRIPLQSVLWINTSQNASLLHTDGGIVKTYMTYTKMKALLDKCADCFLTCYKGCMVNMNRVSRIFDADFIMENGERVQVRKRDGNHIRKSYVLYRCAR
ncbi:MAG: LytTR family transcriptional regulator DNA-binding domain-containing protein [Oscillibacter sp.]|nr:LytTR family transcriptional regulator DNA-binding domain-containing protein [Oscillibacter sp.]MBQ9617288.1 LytTR family transcriptional regulator DNA-binding domain-containing protein [Oscillibacter sp.]